MPTSSSNFARTPAFAIVNGISQVSIIGGNTIEGLTFISVYNIHRQKVCGCDKIRAKSIDAFGTEFFGKYGIGSSGFQDTGVMTAIGTNGHVFTGLFAIIGYCAELAFAFMEAKG